jgi:hypothetical protein
MKKDLQKLIKDLASELYMAHCYKYDRNKGATVAYWVCSGCWNKVIVPLQKRLGIVALVETRQSILNEERGNLFSCRLT